MKKAKKTHYQLADYLLIAMTAALSIAVKAAVNPAAQLLTAPLFIPGGVAAGGFYMLFIVLAPAVTGKRGSALLTALIQSVLVVIIGSPGSHGAASLLIYTLPGLAAEAVWFASGKWAGGPVCCYIAGVCANMAGSYAVNLLIFRLPVLPLMLALCVAALSGGLGGWAAYGLAARLRRLGIWRGEMK